MFKLIKLFILAVIVAFIAGTAYFASKETKDWPRHRERGQRGHRQRGGQRREQGNGSL